MVQIQASFKAKKQKALINKIYCMYRLNTKHIPIMLCNLKRKSKKATNPKYLPYVCYFLLEILASENNW